jgi:hypothetical protein
MGEQERGLVHDDVILLFGNDAKRRPVDGRPDLVGRGEGLEHGSDT